jgi:hypothetical protein
MSHPGGSELFCGYLLTAGWLFVIIEGFAFIGGVVICPI